MLERDPVLSKGLFFFCLRFFNAFTYLLWQLPYRDKFQDAKLFTGVVVTVTNQNFKYNYQSFRCQHTVPVQTHIVLVPVSNTLFNITEPYTLLTINSPFWLCISLAVTPIYLEVSLVFCESLLVRWQVLLFHLLGQLVLHLVPAGQQLGFFFLNPSQVSQNFRISIFQRKL